MFSILPVRRLSMQTTSCPSARRRSQRCEPMKPAPPVIRTLGIEARKPRSVVDGQIDRAGPGRRDAVVLGAPSPNLDDVGVGGVVGVRDGRRRSPLGTAAVAVVEVVLDGVLK